MILLTSFISACPFNLLDASFITNPIDLGPFGFNSSNISSIILLTSSFDNCGGK